MFLAHVIKTEVGKANSSTFFYIIGDNAVKLRECAQERVEKVFVPTANLLITKFITVNVEIGFTRSVALVTDNGAPLYVILIKIMQIEDISKKEI